MSTNEVISKTEAAIPRTVETVTLVIQTLQRQAQQMLLGYAIEIGRRLGEVMEKALRYLAEAFGRCAE